MKNSYYLSSDPLSEFIFLVHLYILTAENSFVFMAFN